MYSSPRFAVYFIVIVLVIGLMWLLIQQIQHRANTQSYVQLQKYHRFLYGALSGTVGAQSVLFGKMMAELLV